MTGRRLPSRALSALGLGVLVLAGCTGPIGEADSTAEADPTAEATATVLEATRSLHVSEPHEATGGTLLEGPAFSDDGLLYLVDVMAPPGAPKVMAVDLESEELSTVYTDEASAFTSAQFSPVDGRLHLTDIVGGRILSMTPEGEDPQVLVEGEVDGIAMLPDDLTFTEDGTQYVSDTRGMDGPGWETPGRVVRVGTDGETSVIAENLPSPNGIVLDETGTGLYVAQYNANRIDHLGLADDGTSVTSAHPAVHVDAGRTRVDSTAVDADGNIYQAFHGKPELEVYAPTGEHLRTITVPAEDASGLDSATNLAVRPGTTEGYMTVSGPDGGYLYAFDALAEGIRSTNGG